MRLAETRPALALVAGAVVAILVVGQLDPFWSYLAVALVVQAIAAMSVGIVYGRSGLVSLCQLSFAAAGAWTMAWFATHAPGTPFVLQVLVSSLVAVPFGALVGLPSLRLRGDVIAVVTLAAAVAATAVLSGLGFPGEDEFVAVLRPTWLADDASYFAFATVCLVLVGLALIVADNGRLGSRWLAAGRSERALASFGHSVPAAKVGAFAAAAFVAGLSGALLAGQVGNISAASFSPVGSLALFALAVMCGTRTIDGAVIAGVLAVGIPEALRRLGLPQDIGSILFGVGAVQALINGGGGISGDLRRALRRLRPGGRPTAELSRPTDIKRSGTRIHTSSSERPFTVEGLTVVYDAVAALTDVSIEIPPRTVVALIGPNGAGKSTLVDTITGFVNQSAGSVQLGGTPMNSLSPARRAAAGIRRTFQSGRAMPDLTIDQYLRLTSGRTGTGRTCGCAWSCPARAWSSPRRSPSRSPCPHTRVPASGCRCGRSPVARSTCRPSWWRRPARRSARPST